MLFRSSGRIENAGTNGAEIITAPGAGAAPQVKIFTDSNVNGRVSDDALFETYLAYAPGFTGGVRVAAGDTDGSGFNVEVLTGPGSPGGSHVVIWDVNPDGSIAGIRDSFLPLGGFSGGLFVAAGDLDFDGKDELAVSADAGGGPQVLIYSDLDADLQLSDHLTDTFFAFGTFGGGVRVAFGDTNDQGGEELICAAGPGGVAQVSVFTDQDGDGKVSDDPLLEARSAAYSQSFTRREGEAKQPSAVSPAETQK